MIFNSGWTKVEIESCTYKEIFEYIKIFYDMQAEEWFSFFKSFSVYNSESTAVAISQALSGKKNILKKYSSDVFKRKLNLKDSKQEDLESQFKEQDFGKQNSI